MTEALYQRIEAIVSAFLRARSESQENLSTDQLLHAVFLALQNVDVETRIEQGRTDAGGKDELIRRLWRPVQ